MHYVEIKDLSSKKRKTSKRNLKNLISKKSVVLPNSKAHMLCVMVSHCVLGLIVLFLLLSGLAVFDLVCPAVCHITGKRLKVVGDQWQKQ